MKLPKILEDEQPLKNSYFTSITAKPLKKYKTQKLIFDWQSAQVKLIPRIPDEQEILQLLIQFQNQCKNQNIPHFYSYFFVEKILIQNPIDNKINKLESQKKVQMIKNIKIQLEQLKNKKCKWHKIVQLIQLRENLVSKIDHSETNNKLQTLYQYLDDIRFINFQIVKKINEWSQFNKTNSQIYPFFLYEGNNYLVKMINDNVNIINILNGKAVKFLSPPNPFYLSRDGNKSSMSLTQQQEIDKCMQILAKEKAQELRMMINPPDFVSQAKNQENQLRKLKNQLENEKAQKIRSVYKSNLFTTSTNNLRASIYSTNKIKQQTNQITPSVQKLKKQKISITEREKGNKFEKLIQQKQIAVVQDLKNSQVKLNINKPINKINNAKDPNGVTKYLSRVESLRKSVQQNNFNNKPSINNIKLGSLKSQNQNIKVENNNMGLSTISNKNQLPRTVAQIKTPKPKIKLIMQKDTFVEDVIKQFLPPPNMEMYKSLNVRRTSNSFFKPVQNQQQKKQQNQIDIKPITQYLRSMSASNITQTNLKKSHSKTKNNLKKSEDKSKINKSKSISNKSNLSLSKSPNKNIPDEQKNNNLSKITNNIDNSQANLRVVNSKLRQLTIMSIYGKKTKVTTNPHKSYETASSKVNKADIMNKSHEKQQQKNKIDQQLKAVKNRLNNLSMIKIYDKKQSTNKNFNSKKDTKEETISLIEKQKEIKDQNKRNEQNLKFKQKQKEDILNIMKQKDKKIQQLLKLLKQQEQAQPTNNKVQENLQMIRTQKLNQIQILKLKIKTQNKLIKQQMVQQEKKFIALKQQEFQMRQQQMMNKYRIDMQQIKEEYLKKNNQLQAKIIQQQRIRRISQLKLLQQQRQLEQLKLQMEQKKLKEQLLEQVLRQQQQKQANQNKLLQQNQQFGGQRIKREILQFEEMERKILQNYQEDNKNLNSLFDEMKRKNEQTQKQNQRKLLLIKKLQQQSKAQQQKLKILQAQLIQARKVLQLEQTDPPKNDQNHNIPVSQVYDMQQIKLKVKEQILRQMMQKKKQQQNKQQIQKKERARKLAQIEEQIRKQLRRQQQQMQRIQKEQRLRFERIKLELEEEHRKKMQQLSNKNEQKIIGENEDIENKQIKDYIKEKQQKYLSKQQYEKQLEKVTQAKKQEQKQNQQSNQIKIHQEQNTENKNIKQIKNQPIQQNKIQQAKQIKEQKNGMDNKQQLKDEKNKTNKLQQNKLKQTIKQSQKTIKQSQKTIKSEKQPKKIQQSHKKIQLTQVKQTQIIKNLQQQKVEVKKQTQTIKQGNDQLLTKYQNLQQYLTKCKQIYIEDKVLPQFLTNFYSSFAPQVKQMLPYTQQDIIKFATSLQKKIDIYDCINGSSIGWMEAEKYILMGQINCVESIVKKYGQTQIQITYIFNKTNLYQKQFLAKQIKIFDKVGFIFQKKLKQDNLFSIKLIIKVPIEILPKNFKPPTNELNIKSKISIEMTKKLQQKVQNNKYSYNYLLSQTLKNCLSAQQQLAFKQQSSQQSRLIQKKMHYKLCNDNKFKSEDIDDKKMRIQANLNLKYMQTHQYPCFITKGAQFANFNSTNGQKLYISTVTKNLSIVIFYYDKSCEDLSLDIILNIKTAKLQKQRQLLICFPLWRKQEDLKLSSPGPKQFSFSYSAESNLAFGSIINTSLFKQEYKLVQGRFVFSLFQTNDNGLLLRPLTGQLVELKDQFQQKR